MKTYFFGWTNIKWLLSNLLAMWSETKSYFSKKRFESNISFLAATGIICCWVWTHRHIMSNSEMIADVTILYMISGYLTNKTEEAKNIKDKEEPKA